jgi:hypothetical protein
LVVDGDEPWQKALPPCPWGHKATKADLAREASTLALSQTLEKIMAGSQAALAKRDEKRRLEKRGMKYHLSQPNQRPLRSKDWTSRPIRQTPRLKYVTSRPEGYLASMDDDTRAWFLKKHAKIHVRDA